MQHLVLIALTSTHDWRHASVVISEVSQLSLRFKPSLALIKLRASPPCIRKGPGFFLYKEGTTIPPLAARVIVRLDFYPACADIRYEHLCVADQRQLNQPTMSQSVSILASALFLKPLGHIPAHKRWTSD